VRERRAVKIVYHHRTQADDGQAVHIRALQQAFVEEGHEVAEVGLVARAGDGATNGASRRSRWGVVAHMPRFARELAEYAYTSFGRPKIVAAARLHEADFIYERYAFGNAAGVQAAARLRIPLILEVNSPMVLELERTRGLSFPSFARRLEGWIFRSADRVCVVTEVLGEMLVELGVARERLLVTPNGVHLEAFDYGDRAATRARARDALQLGAERPGELVLGFVGFYREWHRLDLVLDALARPALAHARLVLIGEGPAHAALAEQAQRLALGERVRFAGPRAHGEVAALLPAFDVALVPAINPYASPLKLFEYMAAGLASIAPDQANLREVLEHERNALLVAPGDGAALAAALERLGRDGALRARLGAAARATVLERDLTWRGNARRVAAAAQALVDERAGAKA
jgi:glycosyltransferase involved in cell wall biosynthesis